MKTPTFASSSVAASVVLAAVTLGVFGSAASIGPESVVLRYHEAVSVRNERELRDIQLQGNENPFVFELRVQTTQYLQFRPEVRIQRVASQDREAIVEVLYDFGPRGRVSKPFILRRQGSFWRIDAEATQLRLRQTFGLE
ncbi:MAG TPA: hypothetical protein PLO61_05060 [Fimbriimonadaceae bacterium]|nr:hypothetical protein [Fimbriimonadaceae bacterium]HRJ32588.1 hypothetical protein [Fimbriimonadaceae bacterium]